MVNNRIDAPLEHYLPRYAALEPGEAAFRLGLSFDAEKNRFPLKFLGFFLYASWPEFSLSPENEAECPKALLGDYARLLILRCLLGGVASGGAGRLMSYREFPWGEVYDRNFQGRCIKRLAYAFASRQEDFARAAEALGGKKAEAGDIAYDLDLFANVRVRLILYAGDEEFPPTSQFLFSDNAARAFSAEDLAVAGDIIIDALKEKAQTR